MRIGLVCHANFGGSGVIATELGLALARRGHQVHFVASNAPSRLVDAPNVVLHRVTTPTHPLFPHGEFGLALASRLIELGPQLDVLHVHYAIPLATSAVLARDVLGGRAPRLVTTVHGTDVLTVGTEPAFEPMVRHGLRKSDAVTAPSRFLAARASALANVAVETISNFVDTSRFFPLPTPGSRVVTHNSNFRSLKRIEDVVEIARRVPAAEFVLIGDGPERASAERFITTYGLKNVQVLGEQRDVVPFLQRSAVFMLPSEIESFGLAALEAMSCGVPVVASKVGGLPEVIEHGATGFLHSVGDVDVMEHHVRALLEDSSLQTRMSVAAREAVLARFRVEPIVDQYEALYARLLGDMK
jgi:L-malate glycosyltransferase